MSMKNRKNKVQGASYPFQTPTKKPGVPTPCTGSPANPHAVRAKKDAVERRFLPRTSAKCPTSAAIILRILSPRSLLASASLLTPRSWETLLSWDCRVQPQKTLHLHLTL